MLFYPSQKLHFGLRRSSDQFVWAICNNPKYGQFIRDIWGVTEEGNYQKQELIIIIKKKRGAVMRELFWELSKWWYNNNDYINGGGDNNNNKKKKDVEWVKIHGLLLLCLFIF